MLAAALMGAFVPSPPIQLKLNPDFSPPLPTCRRLHLRSPRSPSPAQGAPGRVGARAGSTLHSTGLTWLQGLGTPTPPCVAVSPVLGQHYLCHASRRAIADLLCQCLWVVCFLFFVGGFLSSGAFYNVYQEKKPKTSRPGASLPSSTNSTAAIPAPHHLWARVHTIATNIIVKCWVYILPSRLRR